MVSASERVEKWSAKHAERFTDLTLALAAEDRLDFLDPQIFSGWKSQAAGINRWDRNALYRADALIAFMQTLYSNLNLESKHEVEHPHTQGWLKIFRHWVEQPAFEEAWSKTREMYPERFQAFYEDLINKAKEQHDKEL